MSLKLCMCFQKKKKKSVGVLYTFLHVFNKLEILLSIAGREWSPLVVVWLSQTASAGDLKSTASRQLRAAARPAPRAWGRRAASRGGAGSARPLSSPRLPQPGPRRLLAVTPPHTHPGGAVVAHPCGCRQTAWFHSNWLQKLPFCSSQLVSFLLIWKK